MKIVSKYKEEIIPLLIKEDGYANVMSVPKIQKVVVSIGVGKTIQDKTLIDAAEQICMELTGQKPVRTKAKKSIANFKLREGMEIGVMVTLRNKKMYDFLTKLIYVALPRVKDFQGVSANGFDSRGNYNLGIKEHVIFPEIDYDKVQKILGLNVSIVTTAQTDKEGYRLLSLMGMPFRKQS